MNDFAVDMDGKTVLVTGATRGLGLRLARELARAGATVLAHGRDAGSLATVVDELGGSARAYRADLADLEQVRALAERVSREIPRLDVVVHNAVVGGGADTGRREVSVQGHELRMAVNHLAPLLLTRRLLPLLRASAPSRIVNVASWGQSKIDLDDLMFNRGYEGMTAYCRSKLAMVMSTFELAKELRGTGVTVNTLHPAHLMDTDIIHESGFVPEVSVKHGALPTLRLIGDPTLNGTTGKYFNQFDEDRAHAQAYDVEARRRLVELSEKLIG